MISIWFDRYDCSHKFPESAPHRSQASQRVHHIGELQHYWDSDSARLLRRSWRKNIKKMNFHPGRKDFFHGWWCLQVPRPVVGCRIPGLLVHQSSFFDSGDPFVVEVDDAEFRMVLGPDIWLEQGRGDQWPVDPDGQLRDMRGSTWVDDGT